MNDYTLTWQQLPSGELTAATGRHDNTAVATIARTDDGDHEWSLTSEDGDDWLATGRERTLDGAVAAVQQTLADEPARCVRCGSTIVPLAPFATGTWEDGGGRVVCADWTGHDKDGVFAPSHTDDPLFAQLEDAEAFAVHPDTDPCWRCFLAGPLAALAAAVEADDRPRIVESLRTALDTAAGL